MVSKVIATILLNLFISAIVAYVAWMCGENPRELAILSLYGLFGLDAFVLFVKLLQSNSW